MLVSNIQRFSVHDGAGIRTVVFLKGCNLRCEWCHNPENLSAKKQVLFKQANCLGCKLCMKACEKFKFDKLRIFSDLPDINKDCINCLKCAEICPTGAIEICGKEYSLNSENNINSDALFFEIMRDKNFYDESGGGVTFSGGEPLLWAKELVLIIRKLKKNNVSVDIETAGNVDWQNFEILREFIDEFMFDIKCIDSDLHKKFTGCDNKLILENFKKLVLSGANITVRVPIIPMFNADDKNTKEIVIFLSKFKELGLNKIELNGFHNSGANKYKELGLEYKYANCDNLDEEKLKRFRGFFK